MKNGIPVYDIGPVPQSDAAGWVAEDREQRAQALMGNLSWP